MRQLTAEQFREMRQKLGITQVKLASWFGLECQTVARWEKGQATVSGSAAVLAWLLYDEQINGNKRAVRDYVRGVHASHEHDGGT